jgi:hypothetical protein
VSDPLSAEPIRKKQKKAGSHVQTRDVAEASIADAMAVNK